MNTEVKYKRDMSEYISPLARPHDRTLRDTRDQKRPVRIVLHITGRATYNNAEKREIAPLKWLGLYFDKVGNPFAHYSVDPWGRIACHANELQTPMAQGWAAYDGPAGLSKRLSDGRLVLPAWWVDAWSAWGVESPVDLLSERQATPNDQSVAIEFIQYGNQLKLTEAQYTWGYKLIQDIRARNTIMLEPGYRHPPRCPIRNHEELSILGHEDLDPWGRGDRSGGWDPGALRKNPTFSWEGMLYEIPRNPCAIPTPKMPKWAKMPGTESLCT